MDGGKGCLSNWKMEGNFGFAEERENGELAREKKREMGVYIVRVGRQVFGKGNLRVSETQSEYLLRGWESVCSFTSSKITFMKSFVHDNIIFMVKYLVIKF